MELKAYLNFFKRRWWLILTILVATLAATALITRNMRPVYEATATYIVRLSAAVTDERSRINALALLTGNPEIPATYAKVASSRQVKELAAQQLGFASRKNLSVNAQILSGTNVLEITVTGNDPALVTEYANAVGAQTISYTHTLYEAFELAPLDAATRPNSPISPNVTTNMTLGAIFGLALGFIVSLVVENLSISLPSETSFSIFDEKSGLYTQKYLTLRLKEELSRSQRTKHIFSLALLKIEPEEALDSYSLQPGELEEITSFLKSHLDTDEISALVEKDEVIILLPEAHEKEAKERIEALLKALSESDLAAGFQFSSVLITYNPKKADPNITPLDLVKQLKSAHHSTALLEGSTSASIDQQTIPASHSTQG